MTNALVSTTSEAVLISNMKVSAQDLSITLEGLITLEKQICLLVHL